MLVWGSHSLHIPPIYSNRLLEASVNPFTTTASVPTDVDFEIEFFVVKNP